MLKDFKLTKISDLPSDILNNIAIGLFGDTIKYFNAGEVKSSQIIDYQIYLCNFLLKQ